MTEAEILASTYDHTCSVYRPAMVDLSSGETVFADKEQGKKIYEDLPCALSSPSGGKLTYKNHEYQTITDYLLFTMPEIDIQENDFIVVSIYGHEIRARAGMSDYYVSHNETHLVMERKA